jgi:hypothetical protein
VLAISSNKVAPAIADWYLARTGYDAQQLDDVAADASQPDNLWNAVPGAYGARGKFNDVSSAYSLQSWLTRNRAAVALAGLGLGFALSAIRQRHSRQRFLSEAA